MHMWSKKKTTQKCEPVIVNSESYQMKSLEKEKEDYFLLNIFFLNVKYHDMTLSPSLRSGKVEGKTPRCLRFNYVMEDMEDAILTIRKPFCTKEKKLLTREYICILGNIVSREIFVATLFIIGLNAF